jgi:hypothetical protein
MPDRGGMQLPAGTCQLLLLLQVERVHMAHVVP